MKNVYRITFLTLIFAVCGGLAAVNAQSVNGRIAGGSIQRGKSARATIVLDIPGGLHVNSNRPNSEYAVPTTVKATARGARIGSVSYPRGQNRKFQFSRESINVYEGRTTFGFNVTVPKGFRGDTIKVNVAVKYQACTEEVCYTPKTRNITLTARVR